MNDPHIWWYITRASAVVGWVLMTLSVLWGILLSTRILRKADNPGCDGVISHFADEETEEKLWYLSLLR